MIISVPNNSLFYKFGTQIFAMINFIVCQFDVLLHIWHTINYP